MNSPSIYFNDIIGTKQLEELKHINRKLELNETSTDLNRRKFNFIIHSNIASKHMTNMNIYSFVVYFDDCKIVYAQLLYRNNKPLFINIGKSFISSDGNFRECLTRIEILENYINNKPDIVVEINKYLDSEFKRIKKYHKIELTYNSNIGPNSEIEEYIQKNNLQIILLHTILPDIYRLNLYQELFNNVIPSYIQFIKYFSPVEHLKEYLTELYRIHFFINIPYHYKYWSTKMHILTVGESFKIEDITLPLWNELFINQQINKLIINNICIFLPSHVAHFLITNKRKSFIDSSLDNTTQISKLSQMNKLLKYISQLYSIYKNIDTINNEFYLSLDIENFNKKIYIPISYAEKRLIYTTNIYFNCMEHVGFPFLDMLNTSIALKDTPTMRKTIFNNFNTFKGTIYVILYTLYALNNKLGIIHGDLHLNNILMNFSAVEVKERIRDVYFAFTINNNISHIVDGSYYEPNIIDFSRSFMFNYDVLREYFSDYYVKNYLNHNKGKALNFIKRNIPEQYKLNKQKIKQLSIESITEYKLFNLVSAIDTRNLLQNIRSYYTLIDTKKEIVKTELILNDAIDWLDDKLNFCDIYIENFIQQRIKKNINLSLLESFTEFDSKKFNGDFKDVRSYCSMRNPLKYDINDPNKWPKCFKIDECKNDFPKWIEHIKKRYPDFYNLINEKPEEYDREAHINQAKEIAKRTILHIQNL